MHAEDVALEQRRVFIGSHNLTASVPQRNGAMSVLIDKQDLAQEMRRYMLTGFEEEK